MSTLNKGAVCAIIVAAGKGRRMGLGFNKLLTPINGLPVLHWTIKSFAECGMVDKIILVVNPDDEALINGVAGRFHTDISLAFGGTERQQSVYNGLQACPADHDTILIHDGARPFVDSGTISRGIENARTFGAACAGMPVKDTIKQINRDQYVESTPDRDTLWAAQTPQAFQRDIILRAHENALVKGIIATDDAMLAEAIGIRVKMFEGSYSNIKITSKEDMVLAEAIARGTW